MKQKHPHWLKNGLTRVAKIHFLIAVFYIYQIIAYDAAKLITPEVLLKRWVAIGLLTTVAVFVWYLARSKATTLGHYKQLAWILILSDIAFAAFNIYSQRGMSSRAVALFFIPIIISTILMSRVAVFATAILSAIAYSTSAVAYFVLNFNEGYKIELWGEVLFYSGMFIVAAMLLWSLVKTKHSNT